jgi:hypothetical protein
MWGDNTRQPPPGQLRRCQPFAAVTSSEDNVIARFLSEDPRRPLSYGGTCITTRAGFLDVFDLVLDIVQNVGQS